MRRGDSEGGENEKRISGDERRRRYLVWFFKGLTACFGGLMSIGWWTVTVGW